MGLLKLRLVVALTFLAAITSVVAGQGQVRLDRMLLVIVAGGLASAGAACLNHYLDRDIDAVMERTRHRPIPSGRIQNPETAALFGLALIGSAALLGSLLNYASLIFILSGAAFYVLVYTLLLKRRSPLNVVIGGFAGSCAAIAGWMAVDPHLTLTPVLVGLLVYVWTPMHFWSLAIALKDEYRQAEVPMLPVLVGEQRTARIILLNLVATIFVSLLPSFFGLFGYFYLAAALFAGMLALRGSLRLLRDPSKAIAWQNYKLSGMYLGLVFTGMLVDSLI